MNNNDRKIELDNTLASRIGALAETGQPIPVDPDTAVMMGAAEEAALDAQDALDSRFDGGDNE